jgi:UPF0755 protein
VELLVIVDKPALLRVGAALLASVLIIAGLSLIKRGPAAAADFPCQVSSSAEKISIDVSSGETGSEIALELFDKGVTKSQESFFRIAVADQRSSSIAPGIHLIDREICAKDALTQLLDNKRIAGLINVKEGAWVSEIKVAFTEAGYSQKEIDRAFAQATIPQPFSRVEGLLFPAQYSFAKGTPIERAIVEMISRGEQEVMRAGFADKTSRFTEQELLIIASIIQAEGTDDNFGQVSRVIYNRLKIGMPLQMDSTVHYVQAQRGDIFLSTKSTLLKSPFNTYRNAGLPPGPIGNPGRNAMLAAVTPTPGDWLYFITVAPGDTRFTKSFDEFNEWKLIYKANLRAGKFEDK